MKARDWQDDYYDGTDLVAVDIELQTEYDVEEVLAELREWVYYGIFDAPEEDDDGSE